MVILRVLLEMVGQAVDALGQQRDLHLGRTGVALVGAELLDQTLLLVDSKRHAPPLQSPRPGEPSLPRQGGFQNSLFCPQIRGSVPRERGEVKLTEGLRALTR